MSALRGVLATLRARRGRALIALAGVVAASVMLGTAITVSWSLATGFDRAAQRADLPDAVVDFRTTDRADLERRIRALPNVAAHSYRVEFRDVPIAANGHSRARTAVEVVGPGRRGYAVVEGRDLTGRAGEVLIEKGLARAWGVRAGDRMDVGRLGRVRVAGLVVAPDDVAFPLISRPRLWLSSRGLDLPRGDRAPVNSALIWARDPSKLDTTLVQARAVSFGLRDLRVVTRNGVRVLVDQAAGIVIALLIAFSLVAAGAAGLMLGASARADVQRRQTSIGVMRAVGFSRSGVAGRFAAEGAMLALPGAVAGLAIGAAVAAGPTGRLLDVLSELPPGVALLGPLALCLVVVVALVAAATAWPAWRAASLPPAAVLRGAELRRAPRRMPGSGTPLGLGIRLVAARRGRALATVGVLAAAVSVVLLMLALASFLTSLQNDPGSVGRRYDLTADLPASAAPRVARLPGVRDAAPRYVDDGVASFDLGEPVRMIAYPGDHTRFEASPLAEGRRVRTDAEAEIGLGLADALGLRLGGTLAVQSGAGGEVRVRIVGIVRAIENDGRIAYLRPRRLLVANPELAPSMAVRLDPGADRAAVERRLQALGATSRRASGTTSSNAGFLGTLAAVLRVVALVNGLICLYVLIQALTLTAAERRSVLSLLRAAGASRATLIMVLAGGALAVALVAGVAAVIAQRLVLGPLVARLAAGYASVPLGAGGGQVAMVLAGLALLAIGAAVLTARRLERGSIVAGLRGE